MSSRETPVAVVDRLERPVCDDAWNIEHRAEMPLQRADRNLAELLQELRVAQTGVQILFAFLLTLSFTDRFVTIDGFQRGVYVFTLVTSATTVALLVAPVAVHRLLFQRGRKRELVHVGHRMACGCRELGHVMRPAHTHARGRRDGPGAAAGLSCQSVGGVRRAVGCWRSDRCGR